jgi:hypothetical protein
MKYYSLYQQFRIFQLLGLTIFSLTFLGACDTADTSAPGATPTTTQEAVLAVPSTTNTPALTYVPTYIVYAQRVEATAQAIAATLPTASPISWLGPQHQASEQQRDLWERAVSTAVALYPHHPVTIRRQSIPRNFREHPGRQRSHHLTKIPQTAPSIIAFNNLIRLV